jgi:hypothetical protein
MTPLEALQMMEQACERVLTDLPTHVRLKEAAKIVGTALMDADVQKKIAADSQAAG